MAKRSLHDRLRRIFRRSPRVNVLRLEGAIGSRGRFQKGISLESLEDAIDRAFSGSRLKAVALVVNSPGGSPAQSALVHDRIRALADEKDVPVVAFVQDAAASGGYWLACAGDEIYALTSSIVGSIGVVSSGFGFVDAIAKLGIERRIHTAGESKAILDPFEPERAEDVERLKALQGEMHDLFKNHVKARRGDRLNDIDDNLFSGAFWTGEEGRRRGLVDGIGDVRQVMRGRFGEHVRLRGVKSKGGGMLSRLIPGSRLAGAVAGEIETRALWARFGL
ncbi:MAG: S49 family peptidase [Rhodospirillaceae bacterium]|nr:S49 family peptidase [Rhodospirillaceae bacterium]MBT6510102.1 S49 family peptidase [Rhodospirillaceae bacterium]MBT7647358.1 S49 family peptidase [Rhodospirillaceae bacterium]